MFCIRHPILTASRYRLCDEPLISFRSLLTSLYCNANTCMKLASMHNSFRATGASIVLGPQSLETLAFSLNSFSPFHKKYITKTLTRQLKIITTSLNIFGLWRGSMLKRDAIEILEHLNKTCNRHFRLTNTNLKFVLARLKEGNSVQDLKRVINYKYKVDTFFKENPKFLNPETLFRPSNFERYIEEVTTYLEQKKAAESKGQEGTEGLAPLLFGVSAT